MQETYYQQKEHYILSKYTVNKMIYTDYVMLYDKLSCIYLIGEA